MFFTATCGWSVAEGLIWSVYCTWNVHISVVEWPSPLWPVGCGFDPHPGHITDYSSCTHFIPAWYSVFGFGVGGLGSQKDSTCSPSERAIFANPLKCGNTVRGKRGNSHFCKASLQPYANLLRQWTVKKWEKSILTSLLSLFPQSVKKRLKHTFCSLSRLWGHWFLSWVLFCFCFKWIVVLGN